MSEEELVACAQQGNEGALSELLVRCRDELRRAIHIDRRWQPDVSVEDVEQVTHIEVFLRIREFQPNKNPGRAFRAWVRQIARSNLITALRGLGAVRRLPPGRRVSLASTEDRGLTFLESLGWTSTTPDRQAMRSEAEQLLLKTLALLPKDYQTAVRLCCLEGLTAAETAARMGKQSPGAVYMLVSRAKERLRELLGRESRLL